MKTRSGKLFSSLMALALLSLTQASCGDSGTSTPAAQPAAAGAADTGLSPSPSPSPSPSSSVSPNPSPTPSPSPSPSASPSGIPLSWLQNTYKATCEALQDAFCRGFYGFTVTSLGAYKVGPGPSGQLITGHLTTGELKLISTDSDAVLSRSVHGPAFCADSVSIPGVTNLVTMKVSNGVTVEVYHQKLGSTCYINDISTNTKLQYDLFVLMQKYYPVPFPTPPPVPVKNGHWGGQEATLDVTSSSSKLQLDCAHGNISGVISQDYNGHFDRKGTITFEGGPEPIGGRPSYPAEFSGTVTGDQMKLDIQYKRNGQSLTDHFTLTFGSPGVLHRCL